MHVNLVRGSPANKPWCVGYADVHPQTVGIFKDIDANRLRGPNGNQYLADWLTDHYSNWSEAKNNGVKFNRPKPNITHLVGLTAEEKRLIIDEIKRSRPDTVRPDLVGLDDYTINFIRNRPMNSSTNNLTNSST